MPDIAEEEQEALLDEEDFKEYKVGFMNQFATQYTGWLIIRLIDCLID